MRHPLAAAMTAIALAQTTANAGTDPATGTTVAIGGALRDDNQAVWQAVVDAAGGPGSRFVVLATASGQPEATAAAIVANLQRHGAQAQALPVAPLWPGSDEAAARAAAADPRWIAAVQQAQGVFFGGGAQARLVDTLQPGGQATPLLRAVRALWARGGVVAGTSSGAAVLSGWMFRDAPDVLGAMQQPLREGHEIDAGFGFLPPQLLVDQHFIKRGRIGRLLPLMVQRGLPLGLGVEEDSAALVRGDEVQVLGRHGVLVADLSGAQREAGQPAFNLQGARLHWLTAGDRFNLRSRAVQVAQPDSHRLDSGAPGFQGYYSGPAFHGDMLGDGALVTAMTRLVDSDQHEALGLSFSPQHPLGFEWRLYKAADTVGWTANAGDDGSVAHLRLDLRPVRMAVPLYSPCPTPPP